MNWFKNLSIRLKVMAVAGLGILAFSGYFLYSYAISESSIDELQEIERVDFVVLEAASQNNLTLFNVRNALARAIENEDREALEEAVRLADSATESLRGIAQLDPALEGQVSELVKAFRAYYEEARAVAEQVVAGKVDNQDFYQRLGRVAELRDKFEGLLEDFQDDRYEDFYTSLNHTRESTAQTQFIGLVTGALTILLLTFISYRVTRSITIPLNQAVDAADSIANGDWDKHIDVDRRDEAGRLLHAIRRMRDALKERRDEDRREERLKTRLAELNDCMRGDMSMQQLGDNMLNFLIPSMDAQIGAFYAFDEDGEKLALSSSYAMQRRKNLANEFALGESLVGQCALEQKQILLSQVPEDYISISSATGSGTPRNVVVTPIVYEDELKGVLEVGAFRELGDDDLRFLDEAVHAIAVSVHTARNRVRLAAALEESQTAQKELEEQKETLARANEDLEEQAMELAGSESRLQQQQEELKAINEELESQTEALRASEESLQAQQEELRVTNEELESQARVLQEQKAEMSQKNKDLEILQSELEHKVEELELSSKYKSQFLSTMSHELRTPLNSILILSNALADNKKGNLTEKQVEHSQVIHSAGSDLLSLINDILDISKIEEGKMDVVVDDLNPTELAEHFRKHFAHIAEDKGIEFHANVIEGLPEHIFTDRQRLEQIIKNLLSNALKFTEHGSVTVDIAPAADDELPNRDLVPGQTVKFAVTDTGIGIPKEKQKLVFEAFQQADGTTSRKYGGTGLGLTISRELARLLGGDVSMSSEGEGMGTTFTLYLPYGDASSVYQEEQPDAGGEPPMVQQGAPAPTAPEATASQPAAEEFHVREKTVLIIEDDDDFARVLVDLAEDYGLEGHVCPDGETGIEYARHYRPSAIILDIGLPAMDGWEVMEHLKADPRTKDIPVHFLSGKDERKKAMELGAIDFLTKPVNKDQIVKAFETIESAVETNVRQLLVVEDSEIQHQSIQELFDEKGVAITAVRTGEEALAALRRDQVFDCMILDLTLPDMNGLELLERINDSDEFDTVPVIIYTGKDLSRDEEGRLRKYADRIILKTERSSERLLNEASLFLHWLESTLPSAEKSQVSQAIEHRSDVFEGKNLLLVDDDMRNIYALSAQLEELGFEITIANNGREALEALDEKPEMDLVLMDIMMPEMDGYEAMRKIREQARFAKLPVIALTAKAMKEDRAKCIDAGANDYCSKPIDMGKLTSLMRVWLHK